MHAARAAALTALLLFALDLTRPPAEQLSARAELRLIGAYRARASPVMARLGVRCRFEPSCSRYAELAVAKRGGLLGPLSALWRVVRCGPWTPAGRVDLP